MDRLKAIRNGAKAAPTFSGAEISYLLGFDDPNSFFRAFHDWTGETTERARATLAH